MNKFFSQPAVKLSDISKKKLILIPKDTTYPVFSQYIWISIITKYLDVKDIVRLSATCKRLHTLITYKMNTFWYYKYLEKQHKLIVHSFKHISPFCGECLHSEHRPLFNLPVAQVDMHYWEWWNLLHNTIIDEKKLDELNYVKLHKINYSNRTKVIPRQLRYSDFPGCDGYNAENRLFEQDGVTHYFCNYASREHWIPIYYPYDHPIYASTRSPKINYFNKCIYDDYYKKRSRILKYDYSHTVRYLKQTEKQYHNLKNRLKKYQLYMQKYYQDDPSIFSHRSLADYNIIDDSKVSNEESDEESKDIQRFKYFLESKDLESKDFEIEIGTDF